MKLFFLIYDNDKGETFVRHDDTSGELDNRCDIHTASKRELDAWLEANGFRYVGVDDVD